MLRFQKNAILPTDKQNQPLIRSSLIKKDFENPLLKVRGSALTSYIQYSKGIPIDDNGQLEYYFSTWIRTDDQNKYQIYQQANCYHGNLTQAIKGRYWDVIYTDTCSCITENNHISSDLKKNYNKAQDLKINESISVQRWKKN